MCSLIRNQYENVITCFPLEFFIDSKYCPKTTTRIGGLYNHLERNHQKEISIYNFELSGTNPLLLQVFVLIDHLIRLYSIGVHKQLGKYNGIKELLIEFNNSLKSLDKLQAAEEDPTFAVHSHQHQHQHTLLGKSSSFTNLINPTNVEKLRRRASYSRASSASSSTSLKLDECRENYFAFSKAVLQKNYLIRGHQYALLNSIVFTYDRRQDIIWLLKIILQTLDSSSSSGCIFSYLPHYYLVTCLNLCTALRFYFSNENYQPFDSTLNSPLTGSSLGSSAGKLNSLNQSQSQDLDYKQVLKQVCLFLTAHFCDDRIVNNDHKELIAQSLTSLIASKQGLAILENISIENRLNLIKKLTQPFENRPWTHSNLILLRFWKGGNGFAFKKETLLKLSNSLADENLNFVKNDLLNDNPSLVFQQLIIDYFNSNPKQAYLFLTSLLNQLNWSFSEFIGVLQDIQNSTLRQECYLAIDNRQLKICSTCYDLSTALLRVLEMILRYNASLILANVSYPVDKKCLTGGELFANENEYGLANFNSYFGMPDMVGEVVQENAFSANFEDGNLVPNYDAAAFCANLNELSANLESNFGASFDKSFGANFDSCFSSNFESNFGSKFDKQKQSTGKDRSVFCKQETDEILLQQLCSISNQILNRVTMSTKCFRYVRQQLTSSDSMNEFAILSAVLGVLIELIVKNEGRTRYLTLNLLINDLNFQLSSYMQLIGDGNAAEKFGDTAASAKKPKTNVVRYLNGDELKELKRMLVYVASFSERNEQAKSLETFKEEDLCTICYNEKKTALFIPCLHRSCRSCITIHFLRNSECFFCKMQLEKVQFQESNQILYPQKVKTK